MIGGVLCSWAHEYLMDVLKEHCDAGKTPVFKEAIKEIYRSQARADRWSSQIEIFWVVMPFPLREEDQEFAEQGYASANLLAVAAYRGRSPDCSQERSRSQRQGRGDSDKYKRDHYSRGAGPGRSPSPRRSDNDQHYRSRGSSKGLDDQRGYSDGRNDNKDKERRSRSPRARDDRRSRGCRTLCLESQSSAGLRMQPYPWTLDLVWLGHLHGTGCLSARAMDTGLPTVVWRLCLGLSFAVTLPLLAGILGGCAWVCAVGLGFGLAARLSWLGFWGVCVCLCAHSALPRHSWLVVNVGLWVRARVWVAPRHSSLGCWGVWVFVCTLRLYPAIPGWGVRCGCVCLASGFGCAPPLLAGVLGGCALVRCVRLGSGFGLLSAVSGWHFGVCVCFCAPSPLARHPRLGCAVWVCGCGLGFRLHLAVPGSGVGVCACLCARSACTLPLLAGVCGVGLCAWAQVSAAPRHSWPGCWLWACLCARSTCTPPLLAGVCGVGVCVWARVSAAPRHSWLGFWGVCVFVCALRLYPATPGSGVRCGCVCLASGFGCAPPLLAGVFVGCALVRCVRLGSGFGLLSAVSGWHFGVCVCFCAPSPLARHSRLGCAVWVCGCGLGFRLHLAVPGSGVGVCACLCARSACTLPLLAGVCGVGLCAWAQVSAAPRRSWLGCWGVCVFVCALRLYPATPGSGVRCGCGYLGSGSGCAPPLLAQVWVCVCVSTRAPPVPCHSWLGCAVWVCALHLGFL